MDGALDALASFVEDADPAAISTSAVGAVVRHVVDTVGCGAGGYRSRPARIAAAMATGTGGPLVASLYGVEAKGLVDAVAFANGTANRYLDFNDFGASGHPSDMIPAVLAVAEALGSTGREVVAAVYIAYEVATSLAERVPSTSGWDQGAVSSLGVAAAAAKLLSLSPAQIRHALSLAITPSLPLKVTRYGQLSEWKAAAVPFASMTALFATRLAALGMEGPPEPFTGPRGVFEQVWPRFNVVFDPSRPSAIERSTLKQYGACYWGQVAIDMAVRLRDEFSESEIASLEVRTSDAVFRTIGGGIGDRSEKWRPTTRETADHSMPFLVASALRDGGIVGETFSDDRLADPAILEMMDRIVVVEDAALTERSTRDRSPTRMVVHLTDGRVLEREQDFPRGHPCLPMSDEDIRAKFDMLISQALPRERADYLARLLWRLPELENLDGVGACFRAFRSLSE